MSSFPGDTKEEARLVGESGVQDAGTRESTSIPDRLKLRLDVATSGQLRAQPRARNNEHCSITNKQGGER
jgi:hypothetical protein